MLILTFAAEIILLFVLAPHVVQLLYTFLILLIPSRPVAVSVVTAILFPGTIVHELSHLFTAEVLGVKTGKLDLVPGHIQKEEVRTGSVAIAQTDPVRRAAIGLAPLATGLAGVTAVSWFLSASIDQTIAAFGQGTILTHPSLYVTAGCLYLVFVISSTMIPSRVDFKGTPLVLGVIAVLGTAGYLVGFRLVLTGQALGVTVTIVQALVQSLALVVAINAVLLIILKLNIYVMTKILRIRFIRS